MNPYRMPNKPRVAMQLIVDFIARERSPVMSDRLSDYFGMSPTDACVRLNRLWKWGYLRRKKRTMPPRRYEYTASRFGRKAVARWKKR